MDRKVVATIPYLLTLADILKTKVGDVVGCIFEVKCSVGGFLILKQIIQKLKIFSNLILFR
jgi:hypothetical protein